MDVVCNASDDRKACKPGPQRKVLSISHQGSFACRRARIHALRTYHSTVVPLFAFSSFSAENGEHDRVVRGLTHPNGSNRPLMIRHHKLRIYIYITAIS